MSGSIIDITADVSLDRLLVGGKARSLAEMTSLGLRVPPAFVITTDAWRQFRRSGSIGSELAQDIEAALSRLARRTGRVFGDPADPLLLAVRSGAPVSMPGMLDTVINVGLTTSTSAGLTERSGVRGGRHLAQLGRILGEVDDPHLQLHLAIQSVFRSWDEARAVAYRRTNDIDDDAGTAVVVQAMVHGDGDGASGSGVAFSRNPDTGVPGLFGDFLPNAPGEDIASGAAHPGPIEDLDTVCPAAATSLRLAVATLEGLARDLVDVEFTVEDGLLYLLQFRRGLRTPRAAVRVAVDLVDEGVIDRAEAIRRVPPALRARATKPTVAGGVAPTAVGIGVCPGVVTGRLCLHPDQIDDLPGDDPIVLVRRETTPGDVPAMAEVQGILTTTGGAVSHAALVARDLDLPAVVGVLDLTIDEASGTARLGGMPLNFGDEVTIDGGTGGVWAGRQPVIPGAADAALARLDEWGRELGA